MQGGPGSAALQALMKVVVMEEAYGCFSEQESAGEVGRGIGDPLGASEQVQNSM